MKTYITLIIILFLGLRQNAQTTAIPDAYFEQALISLGIDSDGVINGQVLTSDVNNITELMISNKFIDDLTGIEDFVNLEILNCEDNFLTSLDLSQNILLEELYCSNTQFDVPDMWLTTIDLSNNVVINKIEAMNIYSLQVINLRNGNNYAISNMDIDFHNDLTEPDISICIQVDDENKADTNQGVYSSWNINGENSTYAFSENCTLSLETKNLRDVSFYPNPTEDVLFIENSNEIESLQLFNVNGELLKSWRGIQLEKISLSDLSQGIYFVKAASNRNDFVKKIIKL